MQAKVFISYSWSSPEHEDWVLLLAQRLVRDGIDVALDKWDLKEGHDKYVFMESMVNSPGITKVLMILDKKYAVKADERGGGVGTETQIISPNVYENAKQEKFIPIIAEVDDEGHPYIPAYLKGKVYIDLSKEENFEQNYEKLLRNILNRPSTVKPKLGNIPMYIIEDTPMSFKTTTIVRGFDAQVDRHPERINMLAREFFEEFFENLKEFEIKNISNQAAPASKEIYENLTQYLPLKNDYTDMLTKLSKNTGEFDVDLVIKLFEKTPTLLYPQGDAGSWMGHQFDNFKFITHELFVSTVAIFLKYERYDYLDHILNTGYFLKNKYARNADSSPFYVFYKYIETIDAHYEQLKGHKVGNVQADIMLSRLPANLSKAEFINGDMLCYYIDEFNHHEWYPVTYIYGEDSRQFDFFNRLVSRKHFEKVKAIVQVETIEELKHRLSEIKKRNDESPVRYNLRSRITPIDTLIKIESIGTIR
jgi:hypothetical protein